MALLPLSEALEHVLSSASPILDGETVALSAASGRVLACDLTARLTQPPFDASAMDGYALRSSDAASPGSEVRVIGSAAAGHAFNGVVGKGQAVRIFTGAPLPSGADAILIQEDAIVLEDGRIRTTAPAFAGRHIRPCGQDFAMGETILGAGKGLDFSHLTVAAAMNHATVEVYRRPLVAILATGDELVSPGTPVGPSQIIASNTLGVAALVQSNGGEVLDLGIAGDRPDAIRAALKCAQDAHADIMVTLGGASVGEHDLVQPTLRDAGMQLEFWRIAMRPGKPLMVGSLGDMRVLGLPGNPVASLITALLFLEPLVAKLAHRAPRDRNAEAITATPLKSNDQRQDYLRAKLYRNEGGRLVAEAYEKQDSSMMKIMAQSDALIVRPPYAKELPAGSPCPILLLNP